MTADGNPYGDGLAARRTEQAIAALLGLATRRNRCPCLPTAVTILGANV